jgi:pimeloyl-ACP methyl ester carboxylesterase
MPPSGGAIAHVLMLSARCDRRSASLAAALLAITPLRPQPGCAESSAAVLPAPAAVAAIAGGFLIPSAQYQSYARVLEGLGCATVLHGDASTLSRPQALPDGARSLLAEVEACAAQAHLPRSAPLVLVGHSRGCKTCVEAAVRSTRRVAALVLLDPVDQTEPDPSTVLPELETLRVPAAVLGSGRSAYDCAPTGSNYVDYADALARGRAPRLIGLMGRAGHMQFVDDRRALSVDVCTPGKVSDEAVREVARSTIAAWTRAALAPQGRGGSGEGGARTAAAESLRGTAFAAGVEWLAEDL